MTVEPVYTPIRYTVTFVADGKTVATVSFTAEDMSITAPEVPAKAGFVGTWPELTIPLADTTIEAIYTAVTESDAPTESGTMVLPIATSTASDDTGTDKPVDGCASVVGLLPAVILAGLCLPLLVVPILRKKKY